MVKNLTRQSYNLPFVVCEEDLDVLEELWRFLLSKMVTRNSMGEETDWWKLNEL